MRHVLRGLALITLLGGYGSVLTMCPVPSWLKAVIGLGLSITVVEWVRE